MKRRIFIIVGLLGTVSLSVKASDEFRTAALAAIRSVAPEVAVENVRLLATPDLLTPLSRVKILRSAFDPTLARWQVQLQCVPRTACLPTLALVESPDQNLFRTGTTSTGDLVPKVRAGERKQLSADIGTIRMRRTVVSLQSGHAGDQIRVRELNGRKVLLAIILPDGTLSVWRTQ
jgi:hypothetical protein